MTEAERLVLVLVADMALMTTPDGYPQGMDIETHRQRLQAARDALDVEAHSGTTRDLNKAIDYLNRDG